MPSPPYSLPRRPSDLTSFGALIDTDEQAATWDELRNEMMFSEPRLNQGEWEERLVSWKERAALGFAPAIQRARAFTKKQATAMLRADCLDNYVCAPLIAWLAGVLDTRAPLLAWAAMNKAKFAGWQDELALVRLLISAKARVGAPDENTNLALNILAHRKASPVAHPRGLAMLLDAGAEINAKGAHGDTALTALCGYRPLPDSVGEAIKLLSERRADWFSKSDDGSTPVSLIQGTQALGIQVSGLAIAHMEQALFSDLPAGAPSKRGGAGPL